MSAAHLFFFFSFLLLLFSLQRARQPQAERRDGVLLRGGDEHGRGGDGSTTCLQTANGTTAPAKPAGAGPQLKLLVDKRSRRVTRLRCGGFVFGTQICHNLVDAAGITQFLQAVGELAEGAERPACHVTKTGQKYCQRTFGEWFKRV
uniref:Uncharacterized protein n=1 Tax=Oryza sativa subsp. japonica TaxID=39947 RepID=Q8H5A0_ORYSJ|nr:hypothetical protein [Oryza sativa Japonica Group]